MKKAVILHVNQVMVEGRSQSGGARSQSLLRKCAPGQRFWMRAERWLDVAAFHDLVFEEALRPRSSSTLCC